MNEQKPPHGIEWTRIVHHNMLGQPIIRRGYTWNPTTGCFHGCTWKTPDGGVAECYAKTIADKMPDLYPHGFERHYFHQHRLDEPLKVKHPAGIFVGSMADLFGSWVPQAQVLQILNTIRRAPWHIFMLLTKNPYHLRNYYANTMGGANGIPSNVWVGISVPAGRNDDPKRASETFTSFLTALHFVPLDVRFISFEPLWFDVTAALKRHLTLYQMLPFEWAIIGATSHRGSKYQPASSHVQNLLAICDEHRIPVFFKGNLEWSPWREDFPTNMYKREA